MPQPNQYGKQHPEVNVTAADLLNFKPEAPITEAGVRNNIQVGSSTSALAGRQRLRAHLQPDGGRRHRGDLALAGVAVDALAKGVLADGRKVTASSSTSSCRTN